MDELTNFLVGIPGNTANLQLPDPELKTFYQNLEDRVIWIDYAIDESILEVSRMILRFNKEDANIPVEQRKPIKLLVYSRGGDGDACLSLLDIIALSKTKVITVNMGVSMSAGFLILLAGHERYCLPNSTALCHSGSGGTQGTYEQTKAQMDDYERFVKQMKAYIISHTKIDLKLLNKQWSKEWYIYSADQLNFGIVDKIVDDVSILL